MPEAEQTAAEVISPEGGNGNTILAAFVQLIGEQHDITRVSKATNGDGSAVQIVFLPEVDMRMADYLPRHMLPDVYFLLPRLPMTVSGKKDRKRLREIGASFSAQQLAEMRALSQGPKRLPSTKAEKSIQQLWGHVLNLAPESIGLDDNFFRLGWRLRRGHEACW